MLEVVVPGGEFYDEENNLFIVEPSTVLRLEHSLVSISKWEAKWRKPFLSSSVKKTREEVKDYIKCMTVNQNVSDFVYMRLTQANLDAISKYIETDRTATVIDDRGSSRRTRDVITSEVIYWKMVIHGIPFECQKWHLSRLLTLIRICDIKSNPGKKMPKSEILAQNHKLNQARRKAMNTRG